MSGSPSTSAAAVARLRAREQRRDRRHPCLGRLLRDANPGQLEVGLAPPAVVEEPLVDDELDTVGPQPVADRRAGKRSGTTARSMPSDATICENSAGKTSYASRPSRQQAGRAGSVSDGDELDRRIARGDAIALDAPDDRDAPAADLGVEERVADVDRNLVAELRQAERVADQEDIWHGRAEPIGRFRPMDDLTTLRERLAEISDLSRAAGVLGWEQRVSMPPLGTESRAESLATLGRIIHDRFTDPEIGRLLERLAPLEESLPYDSDDASLIRVTRRDWEKARRVPTELRVEMTRAAASGHHAWVEARRNDDFASFLPYLRTNVELKRRYIECFEPADLALHGAARRLRAGHDDDRGARGVRRPAAGADRARPHRARGRRIVPPRRRSTPTAQRRFAERVLATLGFEEGAWRLDPTAHPFCTSFSNRDVRLTTRYRPDDLESVWSTMHEAGHGLYAHGIADSLMRTPLSGAPSLGINESQSRTWENLVGRSRAFWTHWYDPLQETFPDQLGDVELDAFVRAINRAEPGLIRSRRRRDDVLAPHHPPLRARAGADRGHDRPRGPAGGLERADEGVPRRRRARRRARRAPGRALVGRRASATSRPTRSAT